MGRIFTDARRRPIYSTTDKEAHTTSSASSPSPFAPRPRGPCRFRISRRKRPSNGGSLFETNAAYFRGLFSLLWSLPLDCGATASASENFTPRSGRPWRGTRTVYIGNLDEKVTERILYEILIQPGRVVDLYIPCDKETSCPKGYAFAEYETEEIARYAVELFSGLVRLYGKTLKFAISGQDKPSSNGSNPVMPKLNPVPLPKQPQFVHHSDMPVLHTPAYPMVNGGTRDYGFSNYCPYSANPQALPVGPVHSYGGFSNGTYDCSTRVFGSVVNARYGDYVLNAAGHGAPRQPMLYPSY